jgi:hypothetical protein
MKPAIFHPLLCLASVEPGADSTFAALRPLAGGSSRCALVEVVELLELWSALSACQAILTAGLEQRDTPLAEGESMASGATFKINCPFHRHDHLVCLPPRVLKLPLQHQDITAVVFCLLAPTLRDAPLDLGFDRISGRFGLRPAWRAILSYRPASRSRSCQAFIQSPNWRVTSWANDLTRETTSSIASQQVV